MTIKIRKTQGQEEKQVSKLKCELENVVYYKEDGFYFATDLFTGLMITKALKLKELIEEVNELKEKVIIERNKIYYEKNIINEVEKYQQQTLFKMC